jgi:large subunit ribosomal protein L4
MIAIPVKNAAGDSVGEYELDLDQIAPPVNKQLLHDVVVMYEANRRVGTSKTRSRGRVSGSTAKIYRQKGTGRARMGARRTPVRRGGGHTFAKTKSDWSYRLPKKAVRLARQMALRSKFEDGQAFVLDGFSLGEPKTAEMHRVLTSLGMVDVSCLLATDGYDRNVWLSSRNISTLMVTPSVELNAYDLLHQHQFVIVKSALVQLCAPGADASA